MFSGLVETRTTVSAIQAEPGGMRLTLALSSQFDDVRVGDSICIQGCCLTVVDIEDRSMSFQAGMETLSRTTLGRLQLGQQVNCERSLRLHDRLGGHFVTGHIDGLGTVTERRDLAEWSDIFFRAAPELLVQMASKGSIAIDGVSLTLVSVTDCEFSVALIPHTLSATTLGQLRLGDSVNLETDILAKYVQRQLSLDSRQSPANSNRYL
ncbi:MAG: riboflavin synthase [Pirellulaceae bacterium]|nr:riboflavin synthase [Pirellulaceae bacterium]